MDENQDLDKLVENSFSFSRVNLMRISHKWKICNFSIIGAGNGSTILSPEYSSSNNRNIKWALTLYPEGSHLLENYLGLFLQLTSLPNNMKVNVSYQFSILDKNQEKGFVNKYESIFSEPNISKGTFTFVLRKDIINDNYLQNDCLTIQCDMTVGIINKVVQSCVNFNKIPNKKCQIKVLTHYASFLNNELFSDVTIIISNEKLKAHKLILSAHSTVFSAMFKTNMKENYNDTIEITDIKYEVFQELLRFIYSGKIENIDIVVNDLLIAADKYDISSLLVTCEQYLQSNLNVDNVIDVLVFADKHNANNLKQSAIALYTADKGEIKDINNVDFINKLKPDTVKNILKMLRNRS